MIKKKILSYAFELSNEVCNDTLTIVKKRKYHRPRLSSIKIKFQERFRRYLHAVKHSDR